LHIRPPNHLKRGNHNSAKYASFRRCPPFHLDFRRNIIVDVHVAGIAQNWARIPPNVRYFLWQYKGYGVKSSRYYINELRRSPGRRERFIAARSLAFGLHLQTLNESAEVLSDDGYFVLFRITGDNP